MLGLFDSTGGMGRSEVPLKKATLMNLSKQWKLRNQPSPPTP